MGHRPPKGVRPPQLEGKRTGRPKGSRNHAKLFADVLWAYRHRFANRVSAPNRNALVWWYFARRYPDEVWEWLDALGQLRGV